MGKPIKDLAARFLSYGILALLVLGILTGIAIIGGAAMAFLGLRYRSVVSVVLFFGIAALAGFPLEVLATALPKALLALGKLPPKGARALGFFLDAGATALVMTAVDSWMPSISATPASILAISLLLAVPSLGGGKGKGRTDRRRETSCRRPADQPNRRENDETRFPS